MANGLRGAPRGNTNATKGTHWRDAINAALDNKSRALGMSALQACADKLIAMALDGDLGALKELGDRMDGKPKQQVDLGNASEQGLFVRVLYGQQSVVPVPVPVDAD